MEISELSERIIHDINVIFSREANIDEFDIIPVLESQNKSPVINIGTKMALESWCVKFLYLHVHSNVMRWREKKPKIYSESIAKWSEILLMLQPDATTAWNIRKELLFHGKISIADELRLSKLVLTRKPKSPEVFIHRRWLISRILDKQLHYSPSRENLLEEELKLCTISASRYPNNYCAWSQRQWLHLTITLKHVNAKILEDEMKWSEEYVQQHVSDYSGFQFRQFLLKTISEFEADRCVSTTQQSKQTEEGDGDDIVKEANARNRISFLLNYELTLNGSLIRDYPCHEALWYHRRFVLYLLNSFQLVHTMNSVTATASSTSLGPICKRTRTDPALVTSNNNAQLSCEYTKSDLIRLEDELKFINQFTSENAQFTLANSYRRWLSQVLRFDL